MVYIIEHGHIKVRVLSPEGKQCLLALYTGGDLFGELCLAEGGERWETATAMADTTAKRLPCRQFLRRLSQDALLVGFVRFLPGCRATPPAGLGPAAASGTVRAGAGDRPQSDARDPRPRRPGELSGEYGGRLLGSLNAVQKTLFAGESPTIDGSGSGARTDEMPLILELMDSKEAQQ